MTVNDGDLWVLAAVSSQGPAVVEEEEFGEEEQEEFQEQTGGKTQTGQLDVIDALTRGDGQRLASGVNLNGNPHTHIPPAWTLTPISQPPTHLSVSNAQLTRRIGHQYHLLLNHWVSLCIHRDVYNRLAAVPHQNVSNPDWDVSYELTYIYI